MHPRPVKIIPLAVPAPVLQAWRRHTCILSGLRGPPQCVFVCVSLRACVSLRVCVSLRACVRA